MSKWQVGFRDSASVIVTAHAKPCRLRLTLAGLVGQEYGGALELIVVADGASTEVFDVLGEYQKYCSNLRVLESPGLGRAGARNLGADNAKGHWLVFVDDDILLRSDFVFQHMRCQQLHPGLVKGRLREIIGLTDVEDPAQGGVGCRPVEEEILRNGLWSHDGIRVVSNALEQAAERQEGFQAPWLASAGANLSISRANWQVCGGFDERYGKSWGLEDIDFGYRVYRAGIEIFICEQALGLHMSHPQENRWQQQDKNWRRFLSNDDSPEVQALPALLAEEGSVAKFTEAVHQIRQQAVSPC
ncbi:glycosyltransferase family 2 protein [Hahella ganghwensis]|uniref:glycosyltransferase family 2 protein n=1 Tax=Hahella ganghwensis TaxID=286420 RepID=UPI000363A47E|nr:glycosyltransferase [Hahella ganghwensis]